MITEEQCWKILGNNFKTKGFVHHQVESFDNFINVGLATIITDEPPIIIHPKTKEEKDKNLLFNKYSVQFSDVYIPNPTVIEEDRTLRGFNPSEARQRDLTYDSPIYATVTTILEVEGLPPEIQKHSRIVLGRIPIMLRSSKCYLTDMDSTRKDRSRRMFQG